MVYITPSMFAVHTMLCPYEKQREVAAREARAITEKMRNEGLSPEGLSYIFLGVVSCDSDSCAGALVWRVVGYFSACHFSRPPSMIFTLV